METAKVDTAKDGDAAGIVEMEKLCFGRDAWPRTAIMEELSGGFGRRAAVIRDGEGKAVAYCISRSFMDMAEVFKIAVHPLHRRKGFAKLLLKDAARHLKLGTISLEVAADNKEAVALYAEQGFRVVGERKNYYRSSGKDAIVMAMEVVPSGR